ncbi:prepilin-type N-terminal cleavage/methylation domain-containing protein [Anaeromyxobacter oryzae]|uniref:Prepilin-type N-terminal cleavage/methylation domain-containing protein n=1 Tax=Anaeromyxobacter oryzae TaxID=2918170 RepID=A0ABM7WXM6_9BACT|nr:prepilin-type N-terminal cleavage/methylation domain-containing protein [Anaeromyxobacter oryzae]BDG04279.1 hypothetical protein AMOR_32750 [Anaeromyxobacter oryzae]
MTAPRPTRGFTLLELAVSLLLVAILVAGAVSLLSSQRRALTTTSGDRAMQETVRTALDDLGANLRRAGFGIDPALAFDFTTYQCAAPVTCRDSIAGPDEIVFYARDPLFKATISATPSATQLTIAGGLQAPLYRGQILQIMCGAGSDVAYVTVGSKVAANWTPPAAAPASTAIPLLAATGAFPQQNAKLTSGCFSTGWSAARVYRLDRFRYAVLPYADADLNGVDRPYLMLDRGLLDDDGTSRIEPVVADVEDLQLEYVFVNPTTGVARAVGGVSGTGLSNGAASIDLAATPPTYDSARDDATRLTNSPANIRAVRVSVIARLPSQDLYRGRVGGNELVQLVASQGPAMPAAGNRPIVAAPNNFARIKIQTTEALRNMDVRAPFFDQ